MAKYIITQNSKKVVTIFSFLSFFGKGLFYTKKKAMIFIAAIIVATTSLAILTASIIFNRDSAFNEENKQYVLKTHGDFLALYYGGKITEVYEDIVVNSLPVLDREKFLSGVIVEDITKLDEILQDFE